MPTTTFERLKAEYALLTPAAKLAWKYPSIRTFHVGDMDEHTERECIMFTGCKKSALRFVLHFGNKKTMAMGLLSERVYRDIYGCVWYIAPPDENFQIMMETINRTKALITIETVEPRNIISRKMVSFTTPHVMMLHKHVTVDVWIDHKLYAQQTSVGSRVLKRLSAISG